MCSAAETPAFSRCRRRPPRRPTPRWRGSRSEKPRKALARPAASWPASFWPAGFRPAASPAHRTAHGRMLNFGGGHVMDASPLKILCITGWCRNGSTIIGNILGEIAGVFHVGELHFLWKNAAGKGANSRCGCGSELARCPVWAQILPVGRPPGTAADDWADMVIRRQRACVRTRHTWRVLRDGLRGDGIRDYAALMT